MFLDVSGERSASILRVKEAPTLTTTATGSSDNSVNIHQVIKRYVAEGFLPEYG
jgi:hypothetical protein